MSFQKVKHLDLLGRDGKKNKKKYIKKAREQKVNRLIVEYRYLR
ncbi:MAG: hypothetical protein ACMUEL_07795 [Flavobacteriales bacterium Tduv]